MSSSLARAARRVHIVAATHMISVSTARVNALPASAPISVARCQRPIGFERGARSDDRAMSIGRILLRVRGADHPMSSSTGDRSSTSIIGADHPISSTSIIGAEQPIVADD